ncbi:UDP-3-O-(3-hydroxymyristoyl)glucosamine N-acyltransferase [Niabella ginsenosidivorans]|uniref:UDP-3-O-(3-hydroxymyristoyl)glucosamine N-acyltransferase n=1 Tax=Niabella ginsenosidivorans TaxID=1176587 RepID=A0A1A9HZC7_9BACT|nr:UDP-3-O-(3-hydroxymyristoyl)glucosamine N-acyltransferase [Niabella ginsenosidivorans]ANH79674.1 UDP-3-O-(3-hydroxymyristoyl)glucosamine N-acyltransferase [Niabella ginsenosidivorans]
MQFKNPVPLTEIAGLIDARIVGEKSASAAGINEIHQVAKGDLVFVDHPKYYDAAIQSAASYIIINAEKEVPQGKALLIVEEPFEAYLKIVETYYPFRPSMEMLSECAKVGAGSVIMPNVYLGNRVVIGKNCVIYPNVTIMDDCIIGDDVVIQSGTVIGSNAFYYNKKTNRPLYYKRMTSCGTVEIEDGVEIGAGCTIDRGVTGVTRIGAGTKIDNQVHIGHDTLVGKNCLFASQVGIAGATVIEDEVILWGQVGVSKTLTIGRGTVVLAKSGVPSSLKADQVYFGIPSINAQEKRRELVWIKRIPELWEKVNALLVKEK